VLGPRSFEMPKEIVHVTIDRPNTNVPWGFVIIGGKDQSLTVKIGKVKPYSPAENAGLKSMDYLHTINGKEVFEMTHNECVEAIKKSGTSLQLSTERGDHIVPNFEEIWPSKKGEKARPKRGLEYYYDAMQNGPQLSGFLPLPPNFTTVGKPQIVVNQYDSPMEVYSDETLEEMKEERLTMQNPEVMERIEKAAPPGGVNPMAAQQARNFDPTKSAALSAIGN
jgi:hypothetical protein